MDKPRLPTPRTVATTGSASGAGESIKGSLGPLIEASRRTEGLTRAQLAARLDVPEAVLALWEDPDYDCVDLSMLNRVARALGRRLEVRLAAPRRDRRRPRRGNRPAWEDLISR